MEESDAVKDTSPTSQTVSTATKERENDLIVFYCCIAFLQNL